jgi:hypothetical protein
MSTLLKIRIWLGIFIFGLVVSGLTVFPIKSAMMILLTWFGAGSEIEHLFPEISKTIMHVHEGVTVTLEQYPFIFYGTDWLGFAHILLGLLFLGPLKDPIKNIWVIEFGVIACILVIPFAFICGPSRGIPIYWTLADCCFGIFGIIPLLIVKKQINLLETAKV